MGKQTQLSGGDMRANPASFLRAALPTPQPDPSPHYPPPHKPLSRTNLLRRFDKARREPLGATKQLDPLALSEQPSKAFPFKLPNDLPQIILKGMQLVALYKAAHGILSAGFPSNHVSNKKQLCGRNKLHPA